MQPEISKQVQNSEKNIEIKHPKGDRLLIGLLKGSVLDLSLIEKKTIHHKKTSSIGLFSMAKTPDNKSQFVCNIGDFRELDLSTHKQLIRFNVGFVVLCVVTHDNKSLITASNEYNCYLTKWSLRTKKRLHTWMSGVEKYVFSQSCTYDNKYQLIGYDYGWLGIFDLKKNQTLINIEALSGPIFSVAFTQDNQRVFISDENRNIKMINWQADANSGFKFDFTQKPEKVGKGSINSICLTKDDKYLLVGSKKLVSVFETATRKVTKEFKLKNQVAAVSLTQYGKRAIIAEESGEITILDLETLEISSIAENMTGGDILNKIIVI